MHDPAFVKFHFFHVAFYVGFTGEEPVEVEEAADIIGDQDGDRGFGATGSTDGASVIDGEIRGVIGVGFDLDPGDAFDLVLTSPLVRAWKSASLVVPGLPIRLEGDLREIDFIGIYPTLGFQQIGKLMSYSIALTGTYL